MMTDAVRMTINLFGIAILAIVIPAHCSQYRTAVPRQTSLILSSMIARTNYTTVQFYIVYVVSVPSLHSLPTL